MASISQTKGHIAKRARSNQRYYRLLELSEEGVSRTDAAATVGMTIGGMENLLYQRLGSKAWPIERARMERGL